MKNKEKLVSYCRENNLPILHKQTDFGDMLYTKWGNMTVNMYRLPYKKKVCADMFKGI